MRWELTVEQEMFRDSFQEWLRHHAPLREVRRWQESGDAAEFERRLVADGWLAVGSLEDAGGQGGGLLELALTAEQLGRGAAPSSAWTASVLAVPALAELAVSVLQGGEFAAYAVSADAPLDAAVQVRGDGDTLGGTVQSVLGAGPVRADGDTLNGTVQSVLGADRARRLIVPAGGELFGVDVDAAGVEVAGRRLLDRSRSVADVTLTSVSGRRLDVDGARLIGQAASRAAVLVAADSLGAAERMLELAVEYSKQRKQFGVPIGSFQAVKHAAASMLVAVESSRSIVYFAAESLEQGHPAAAAHVAVAKAQVTAAGARVADDALTLHGAIGYTWEHDLQLLYKRAKLDERLYGSPAVWNERLASLLPLVPA
jgi:alkylation response protein AidB-like acyl-CoA dehydrogenase